MSEITTPMMQVLEKFLNLTSQRHQLITANMANIDTPGYQAVGMDFEAEMRQSLSDVDKGNPGRAPRVQRVDGLIARPDGNAVSMDRESLNLAEAQLRFKTGVTLLRAENQRVLDAIRSGSS